MSTEGLGRDRSPATHQTNAFAMLKKTAQDEQPAPAAAPAPKPESAGEETTHENKPKTPTKARTKRATESRPRKAKNTGGVEPPEPTPTHDETEVPQSDSKERVTELVTLYMPLDLRAEFKRRAKAEGATHPGLAFTAVEVAYPVLDEILGQIVSRPVETPTVSLFQRAGTQARARTTHKKDYGDLQFRITKTNAAILDGLVEEFNAPSRNVLITTAIRHYLNYPITDEE